MNQIEWTATTVSRVGPKRNELASENASQTNVVRNQGTTRRQIVRKPYRVTNVDKRTVIVIKGLKRLKVSTFIYRHLQGNPNQQRFTTRSGVLTGNDTSGAAQVATVYCPNERTLDPAVCSYKAVVSCAIIACNYCMQLLHMKPLLNRPTYAPASRTMAFTPQCSPATTHYF